VCHVTHLGEQVPLDVVVAVRDHRAVQAEDHPVHRHGRPELRKDLVAELLVGVLPETKLTGMAQNPSY
jgi:hypothetical protein